MDSSANPRRPFKESPWQSFRASELPTREWCHFFRDGGLPDERSTPDVRHQEREGGPTRWAAVGWISGTDSPLPCDRFLSIHLICFRGAIMREPMELCDCQWGSMIRCSSASAATGCRRASCASRARALWPSDVDRMLGFRWGMGDEILLCVRARAMSWMRPRPRSGHARAKPCHVRPPRHGRRHGATATATTPRRHGHGHGTTATAPRPRCRSHGATATVPRQQCHGNGTAAATAPQPRCHGHGPRPWPWVAEVVAVGREPWPWPWVMTVVVAVVVAKAVMEAVALRWPWP